MGKTLLDDYDNAVQLCLEASKVQAEASEAWNEAQEHLNVVKKNLLDRLEERIDEGI
ncbi:hypothetical protein LCGC14_0329880 [marine sediment metagenome]|uniref:Uncharacterized protein n=1 Tax=marine sediment metagenome TaxID=412755 RepID=A0A0F9TGP1_9ZZZZ